VRRDLVPSLLLALGVGCGRPPASAPAAFELPAGREAVPEPAIAWQPRAYLAPRAGGSLEIDGRLDEPSWRGAAWTEDFVDIEGPSRPAPRHRTRAKILWDDAFLYVGAELTEPDLWATLTERDSVIYRDPDFEVFVDPDGDTHQYYELEINALGTVWDLFLVKPYRDGGPAINAWDIRGLRSAVATDGTLNRPGDIDRGWTVELALPWTVLGEAAHRAAPPAPGDRWRMNFSRVEWRTEIRDGRYEKSVDPGTGKPLAEDNWVWSPQGRIAMHYPEMWGFVEFSSRAAGSGAAGGETGPRAPTPRETAGWLLRLVYYRERSWFAKHGAYTGELRDLGLAKPPLSAAASFPWPPAIATTPGGFEASLPVPGEGRIRITDDGALR
jgi:hypothetical protein